MKVRDTPTWHLAAINVDCMGLSLPAGLSASVNSPGLRRVSHTVFNNECIFKISTGYISPTYA